MSPIRAYRCEAGHEFEQYEHMDDPPVTECVVGPDEYNRVTSVCVAPVHRILAPTNAHVKGGTPRYHKGKV